MLRVGMYVRCPIKDDNPYIRTFFMGQIAQINQTTETCTVDFHDIKEIGKYLQGVAESRVYRISALEQVKILPNSLSHYDSKKVTVLCWSTKDTDGFNHYYVQYQANKEHGIFSLCEKNLQVQFTRANQLPVNQLARFELQHPNWYLNRRKVTSSVHMIDNSPYGFTNILGTRVQLFPHQIDTVIRGLSMSNCRLMLADEVGLGKTIEALSIISGMIERQFNFRALIIVPSSLEYQWQTEVFSKFSKQAPIWGKENIHKTNFVIISYESLVADFIEIMKHQWEIIVIDETHKIISNEQLYSSIYELSRKIKHLLILSATPIMNRESEYRKLLQLLNPKRFEFIDTETFRDLLNKQTYIRNEISELIKDIGDYYTYDLRSHYVSSLTKLSDLLSDPILIRIVNEFVNADHTSQVEKIRIALSYLAEFYQIDRGVVRHRKRELDNTYIIRGLQEHPREISDSTVGSVEKKLINHLVDILNSKQINDVSIKKDLISSSFSSPFALRSTLKRTELKHLKDDLVELNQLNTIWLSEVEKEINTITLRAADTYSSKFGSLINSISERDDNQVKFLIFTSYTDTAIQIEKALKKRFGQGTTVSFHYQKTPEEMQKAADEFQDNKSCRYMVCDESGGEGRNFQIADYIIHFDMPWSIALLEQRIGRLDRIGRDESKDVISVVIYNNDSIEKELFDLYNLGLSVFEESMCGLEIAFGDIQSIMDESLTKDIEHGLREIIPEVSSLVKKMNEEITKERFFDSARQLDYELSVKINRLVEHFTKNDCEELMETMMRWPYMAGFRGLQSVDLYNDLTEVFTIDLQKMNDSSIYNSLYVPPSTGQFRNRFGRLKEIQGTFSRTAAVLHENLQFFAPGNQLFDSIINNAIESYKGRSTAFKYFNSNLEWSGFVLKWNISYNPKYVYSKKFNPDLISLVMKYLPSDQYTSVYTYDDETTVDAAIIEHELEIRERITPLNLGSSELGRRDAFINSVGRDEWGRKIKSIFEKSISSVKDHVKMSINTQKARHDLEDLLLAREARKIFYGYDDENDLLTSSDQIDALLRGLVSPTLDLDSIAYVCFTKSRENQ